MTHPSVPQPHLLVAAESVASTDMDDAEGGGVELRQCGRCRGMFDGDPTLSVQGLKDWWLCPACEAVLLVNRTRKSNVIPIRPNLAHPGASTIPPPAGPDTP